MGWETAVLLFSCCGEMVVTSESDLAKQGIKQKMSAA